ncbi:hypothetical protein ACJX0J_028609 [Zea mays]
MYTEIAPLCGMSFNKAKDFVWRHDLFEDSMVAAGLSGIESGTKLYISNLHYGVTSEDLQELFSEMGHLKHCAVHYDSYRHPTGSAEVIFTRRSEALAALKRYNNMRLDGKAMKIEVIGAELGLSAAAVPQISVVPGASRRGQREVVMMPGGSGFGQGASGPSSSLPGHHFHGYCAILFSVGILLVISEFAPKRLNLLKFVMPITNIDNIYKPKKKQDL